MWIEEEITLAEFSERFLGNADFETPAVFDMSESNIEIETISKNGDKIYKPILSFLVKDKVNSHYTDGTLHGSSNHRIIENETEIFLKYHNEFYEVNEPMNVVDIEVDGGTYLANGRLNHNTTSGGKALAFHSSVRLRLKNMGQIKVGSKPNERIIGMKVRCQVIKNRMGPPLRSADFDIFFDSGIDNLGSWLKVMKENGLVKQAGAWYTYVDTETGEEHKFQSKDFKELVEAHPDLQLQMYIRICDSMVLSYKTKSSYDPEEITIETNTPGMDE